MIRYIADLHFDNEDIIAYDNRPFDSVEEMNKKMVEKWNRVITDPNDMTWILGDFCSGGPERWEQILKKLKGRKGLILGNHDERVTAAAMSDYFEDISDYREIMDGNRHVVLCHYPILGFHDQYFSWYHLYGHVHSSYEWNVTENAKRLLKKLYVREDISRMANVGAMMSYMDYRPRSLDELVGFGVF